MRNVAVYAVIFLLCSAIGVLGADSASAQKVYVTVVEAGPGKTGLLFSWDYFNPKLAEGPAWLILQGKIHLKSTITTSGGWGGLVTANEPWLIEVDPGFARDVLCGGAGLLHLAVKDSYGNEHYWSVPFSEVIVRSNRLYLSVKRELCAPLPAARGTYARVPGASPIADIDAFLVSCPARDELKILMEDFPVLFEPPMRPKPPQYECTVPPTALEEIPDQLPIYQALRVIRHMVLSQPLPWTSLHPYAWFKSKIGAIVVSYTADKASCCHTVYPPGKPGGVLAITIPKADQDLLRSRLVWRDPQSGTGLFGLMLLLFHEARHVDLPHDCGYKDSSLSYMGAWAVQYYMALWMAEGKIDVGLAGTPYPPYLKQYAEDLLKTRFCDQGTP